MGYQKTPASQLRVSRSQNEMQRRTISVLTQRSRRVGTKANIDPGSCSERCLELVCVDDVELVSAPAAVKGAVIFVAAFVDVD